MENQDVKIAKLRLHFNYVVLILVGIIILLATCQWTELPKFTDYLTSAGTMVSIVLGVLAIIYSFVSGDSISKSLGNVSSAADQLQDARKEFFEVVSAASTLDQNSRESAAVLKSVITLIRSQVDELTDVSDKISNSNAEIAKTIEAMPARFDKIDKHLEESLKGVNGQEAIVPGGVDHNEELAKTMVRNASIHGTAFLFACAKSVETGTQFPFNAPALGSDPKYLFGYMMAVYSAGIIDFEEIDDEKLNFKITKCAISSSAVLELAQEYIKSGGKYGKEMDRVIDETKKLFAT